MQQNRTIKYLFISVLGIVTFFGLSHLLMKPINSELKSGHIILSAKVLEDDVFQLFYWESSEQNFSIKKSVRTKVKGSPKLQEIAFELPDLLGLQRLRLDIGENKNQEVILIESLKFSSDKNEYTFNQSDFNQLFAPNKYVKPLSNGKYSAIPGFKDDKEFHDPYFISVDSSEQMAMIKNNKLTAFPYLTAALACLFLMVFLFRIIDRLSASLEGTFIAAFMLILILPTLQNEITLFSKFRNLEKRNLAEKPDFSLTKKFARDFETYYDDNFGFRNRLVSWGGAVSKFFKSSKNPDLVMFGKDNWLFYNRRIEDPNMFESYSRQNLLTPDTLNLLVKTWEERKSAYEAQGKKYLLGYWPNKHSIYPEKMPFTMKSQVKDTISRVDQILGHMKKIGSNVRLTDVRQKLLEKKKDHQIYYKADSHWNDYGAFLGYQEFFNQNHDILGIDPKSEDDFDIKWSTYYGGELIQLLGVANRGEFEDQRPELVLKKDKDQIQYLPIDGYPRLTIKTKNEKAGNKMKVLIFRDSFSRSLVQFFSLHFYEVTYIWGHKEYYVNKENPDLIIDCFVEREIGEEHTVGALWD